VEHDRASLVGGVLRARLPVLRRGGSRVRDEIAFTVVGTPAPKGSAKAFWSPKHARVMVWADNRDRLKVWEDVVRTAALRARGRDRQPWAAIPVHLELTFVFARPLTSVARNRIGHFVKPDLSKLVRGFEDALTGVLFQDDAQIVWLVARKDYAPAGEQSRVDVKVWVDRGE
jgi:Holliday junction resolvase RusA-like endonuclease